MGGAEACTGSEQGAGGIVVAILEVSIDRMSQLELGQMYSLEGETPGAPGIVPQVFQLRGYDRTYFSGNPILLGKVWWRLHVWGRDYSGSHDAKIMGHHVNLQNTGALGPDQGKHGLRLVKIDAEGVGRLLGRGNIYNEWLRDWNHQKQQERVKQLVEIPDPRKAFPSHN